MITAKTRVILFAKIIGRLWLSNPYIIQRKVPRVKKAYIENDIPFVCLVWIVCIACGRNEKVVQTAASNPIIVIKFIVKF